MKLLLLKNYNNKNDIVKILYKPDIFKNDNNLMLSIIFKNNANFMKDVFYRIRNKLNCWNQFNFFKQLHYVFIRKEKYDTLEYNYNYNHNVWRVKKLITLNLRYNIQKIKTYSYDLLSHLNNSFLKSYSNIYEWKHRKLFNKRLYLKGQRGKFILIKRYYKYYLNKMGKNKYKKLYRRFVRRWDDLKIQKINKKMDEKLKIKIIFGNIFKKRLKKIFKEDNNDKFFENNFLLTYNKIEKTIYKDLSINDYFKKDNGKKISKKDYSFNLKSIIKLKNKLFNKNLVKFLLNNLKIKNIIKKNFNISIIINKINILNKKNNLNYFIKNYFLIKKKKNLNCLYYFKQFFSVLYKSFNLKKWTYNFINELSIKIKLSLILFYYILKELIIKNLLLKNKYINKNYNYDIVFSLFLYYTYFKIFFKNILKNIYLSYYQSKYKYIQNNDVIIKKKTSNNYYVTSLLNSVNTDLNYIPNNYNSSYNLQYNYSYESIIKNQEVLYLNKYSNLKININKFFEDAFIREKNIKNNQYFFHLQDKFFNKYIKNRIKIFKHTSLPIHPIFKEKSFLKNINYKFTGVIDKFYKDNGIISKKYNRKHNVWLIHSKNNKWSNYKKGVKKAWNSLIKPKKMKKIKHYLKKSLQYIFIEQPNYVLKRRMQNSKKNKRNKRYQFNSIIINHNKRIKLSRSIKFYNKIHVDRDNNIPPSRPYIKQSNYILPKELVYNPRNMYL